MTRVLALFATAGLLLAPAAGLAQVDNPGPVTRLRACLASGSAGAPRDSLQSAVVAVRSLCYTQIRRALQARLRVVDARFGGPAATLTPAQADARAQAREAEIRRFNDEVAAAISNFTKLTQ